MLVRVADQRLAIQRSDERIGALIAQEHEIAALNARLEDALMRLASAEERIGELEDEIASRNAAHQKLSRAFARLVKEQQHKTAT